MYVNEEQTTQARWTLEDINRNNESLVFSHHLVFFFLFFFFV